MRMDSFRFDGRPIRVGWNSGIDRFDLTKQAHIQRRRSGSPDSGRLVARSQIGEAGAGAGVGGSDGDGGLRRAARKLSQDERIIRVTRSADGFNIQPDDQTQQLMMLDSQNNSK